jgi:hypothetical protein
MNGRVGIGKGRIEWIKDGRDGGTIGGDTGRKIGTINGKQILGRVASGARGTHGIIDGGDTGFVDPKPRHGRKESGIAHAGIAVGIRAIRQTGGKGIAHGMFFNIHTRS